MRAGHGKLPQLFPTTTRTCSTLLMVLMFWCGARAQDATFEVVSVKESPPAQGPVPMRFGIPQPGGRWVATNSPLVYIIRSAYPGHDRSDQLVGAPDWATDTRYDINARAAGDPPRDQIVAMARAMLADRFTLRVHTETREAAGYALVLARSDGKLGPSLKPPAVDCEAYRAAQLKRAPEVVVGGADCTVMMAGLAGSTRLIANGFTLKGLATILAEAAGGPIVDATGIDRPFDIRLEFASEKALEPDGKPADVPSLFTALQEQLGLKLESRRVPTEVLVIDHVERPTPD